MRYTGCVGRSASGINVANMLKDYWRVMEPPTKVELTVVEPTPVDSRFGQPNDIDRPPGDLSRRALSNAGYALGGESERDRLTL